VPLVAPAGALGASLAIGAVAGLYPGHARGAPRAHRGAALRSGCATLIRRSLFEQGFSYSKDLTSYEDWLLYLELHRAGHHGAVIPERLIQYRVRDESMMQTVGARRVGRIYDEIRAHLRESEISWSPRS